MVDKTNLVVIPARKNSKRLPGKNLLKVGGISLLERTLKFAKQTGFNVLVSTDCEIMQEISLKHKVYCPWLRPEYLSNDTAKSVDVIFHALDWYENNINKVNNILLLQPTSPFRDIKYFEFANSKLQSNNSIESFVSVSLMHQSPFWNFYVRDGLLSPVLDLSGVNIRSQDLEKTYNLNGNMYLIRAKSLKEKKQFITEHTRPIIMDDKIYSVDIDEPYDYELANIIAKEWNI
jgi:CMP-N,N'-diacetyllegionaminic acid synthase